MLFLLLIWKKANEQVRGVENRAKVVKKRKREKPTLWVGSMYVPGERNLVYASQPQ